MTGKRCKTGRQCLQADIKLYVSGTDNIVSPSTYCAFDFKGSKFNETLLASCNSYGWNEDYFSNNYMFLTLKLNLNTNLLILVSFNMIRKRLVNSDC